MTDYVASTGHPIANLTLNAGDTLVVSSGGSATNVTVTSGASADIQTGGSALALTVASGAYTTIEGNAINVTDGGFINVLGGSVQSLTVQSGGAVGLDAGSQLNGATIAMSGNIADGGTETGVIVSSGGELSVTGTDSGATILSGGEEDVSAGGTVSGATVAGGTVFANDTGVITGATVSAHGIIGADNGGLIQNSTLLYGGSAEIGDDDTSEPVASATGLIVHSGAAEIISGGGAVSDTSLASGGLLLAIGGGTQAGTTGAGTIASAGVVRQAADGGYRYLGLTTTGDTIGSGASELVFGTGGQATGAQVQSGGLLDVLSGGKLLNPEAVDTGFIIGTSGGTAISATLGSGGILLANGDAVVQSTLVQFGGAAGALEGTLTGTHVESGGVVAALDGGDIDDSVISSGGAAAVYGGTASGTDVLSGAVLGVENASLFGSDIGSAVSTTLQSGGYFAPLSGTFVSATNNLGGTVVSSGVLLAELQGGPTYFPSTASGLAVTGGSVLLVESGGTAIGGTASGAFPITLEGETLSLPTQVIVTSGGTLSGMTISDEVAVALTGIAHGNTLTGSASEIVSSGGTDIGLTLNSGTEQDVVGGGVSQDAIVNGGGVLLADVTEDDEGNTTYGDVSDVTLRAGGAIEFAAFLYEPGTTTATYDSSTHILTVTDNDGFAPDTRSVSLVGTYTSDEFILSQDSSRDDNLAVTLAGPPCYAAGTHIMTADGDVPVESLAVGDSVLTHDGRLERITWIGHRRVQSARHPEPEKVWPVLVQHEAFGSRMPSRALRLSPDHAVFVEGVLIPIKHLVNGTTIAQQATEEVTYYHIELDSHDVILAEGLPCESYLETGARRAFANGGDAMALHPDFDRQADNAFLWESLSYAPLVVSGPVLDRAREALDARAIALAEARPAAAASAA